MSQVTYEIHLRGPLPPRLLPDLRGATLTEAGSETLLLTLDLDQEELHDLVRRLRDLGIELLELRQVTASRSSGTTSCSGRSRTPPSPAWPGTPCG